MIWMVPYPSSFIYSLTSILLGPNYSQGYINGALVSIIEGYRRIRFIFMIGFNMYNIYELLYGALIYGKSYIFPNLLHDALPIWMSLLEESSLQATSNQLVLRCDIILNTPFIADWDVIIRRKE